MSTDFKNSAVTTTENAVATVPAENSNVSTPADYSNELDSLSVEQLTMEAKFYYAQMAQNTIEFGKRLIAVRKKLPHGEWLNWLKINFNLGYRTAQRYMEIADRFSNASTSTHFDKLTNSQMTEMLALPAGEEENFIEQKAAEGNPVEDMTIKQLRAEIKQYKDAVKEKELEIEQIEMKSDMLIEKLRTDVKKYKKDAEAYKTESESKTSEIARLELKSRNLDASCKFAIDDALAVRAKNQQLQAEIQQLQSEKSTIAILPPDYEDNKKQIVELQAHISELQNQIEHPTVEIISGDDEEKEILKKKLADLQAAKKEFERDFEVSKNLEQLFNAVNFLYNHQHNLAKVFQQFNGNKASLEQLEEVFSVLKKSL